jgi:NAD(P) transhydrogenase subunit alpha
VIIGVPREIAPDEARIALVPEAAARLTKKGFEIQVEAAGTSATYFPDAAFEAAGAKLISDAETLLRTADLVAKVQAPRARPDGVHEVDLMREHSVLLSILRPFVNADAVRRLAQRQVTAIAMDLMPRITRAQNMDVLSSQSTVAGYKAVLIAANALPKLMPMLMTAAGTLRPARVLVLGAGVAGLQAIATARRLGAVVEAFDIRAAVKEQVESLGARFVAQEVLGEDLEGAGGYARELTEEQQAQQRAILSDHMAEADVIICTALVPGRRAPVLMTRDQVERMRPGALVVDLAAEQGGNCELTRAGEIVDHGGVRIHGPANVPSSVPIHASQMLARNIENYVLHLAPQAELVLDLEDELTRAPMVTHAGAVVEERVRGALEE